VPQCIFELENVDYGVDGKTLVKDFSTQVQRGDKIALIGPTSAFNWPSISRSSVVLPQPFGPIRAILSPRCTWGWIRIKP
jgi:ABC-type uncharacterized transport system YnjBCD ATPase subunit